MEALATPEQPLAELTRASLLLKLMPLFSGDFQVDHLLVDGARIHLAVDKAGKGNWEALTQSDKAPAPAEAASTDPASANLTLDIQDISLTNSQVSYRDAKSGQTLALRDINLHLTEVNTRADPFPLTLALAVEMEGAAFAQVCHDFGVPLAVVRTISDRADDAAHVDFSRFLREVASRYSAAIVEALLADSA